MQLRIFRNKSNISRVQTKKLKDRYATYFSEQPLFIYSKILFVFVLILKKLNSKNLALHLDCLFNTVFWDVTPCSFVYG
jgi:hypothetical protein